MQSSESARLQDDLEANRREEGYLEKVDLYFLQSGKMLSLAANAGKRRRT